MVAWKRRIEVVVLESSLSGFEVPDAEVDESKSADKDEPETTVAGDVKTVSKGERKTDAEGSEDAPSSETERQERHTKAYKRAACSHGPRASRRLRRSTSGGQHSCVPRSRGLHPARFGGFCKPRKSIQGPLQKILSWSGVSHSMSGQAILSIIEDIDRRAGAPGEKNYQGTSSCSRSRWTRFLDWRSRKCRHQSR